MLSIQCLGFASSTAAIAIGSLGLVQFIVARVDCQSVVASSVVATTTTTTENYAPVSWTSRTGGWSFHGRGADGSL